MLDYISQKEYNNIQTKRDMIKTIPNYEEGIYEQCKQRVQRQNILHDFWI